MNYNKQGEWRHKPLFPTLIKLQTGLKIALLSAKKKKYLMYHICCVLKKSDLSFVVFRIMIFLKIDSILWLSSSLYPF